MNKEISSKDRALVSGSLPSIFSKNSPQSQPQKDSQAETTPKVLTVDNTGKEYDSKKIKALGENFLSSSSSSQIQAKSKPQDRSATTPSKIQAGSFRSVPQGSLSSSGQHHQESIVTNRSEAPGISLPRIQTSIGASNYSDTSKHTTLMPTIELKRESKGGQRQQQATPSTPSGKIVSSTSRPKTDGPPANRVTPDTHHTPPSARSSISSLRKPRTAKQQASSSERPTIPAERPATPSERPTAPSAQREKRVRRVFIVPDPGDPRVVIKCGLCDYTVEGDYTVMGDSYVVGGVAAFRDVENHHSAKHPSEHASKGKKHLYGCPWCKMTHDNKIGVPQHQLGHHAAVGPTK